MNIRIRIEYGRDFIDNLIVKFIEDIKFKLEITNFELLDKWLQVEYGLDNDITCKKIIEYALDYIRVVTTPDEYIIQFNPTIYYTGTTIRLITLLKTITYGTRHFKGTPILIDEFKQLNMNLDNLYNEYNFLGEIL